MEQSNRALALPSIPPLGPLPQSSPVRPSREAHDSGRQDRRAAVRRPELAPLEAPEVREVAPRAVEHGSGAQARRRAHQVVLLLLVPLPLLLLLSSVFRGGGGEELADIQLREPLDGEPRAARTHVRNVRSDARWSHATEPVFL
ncbi:hypothetical protein DL767_008864 [Monosporascus sp. MG133]|nr:hypothetical protein DL767_008864 [Monosporascus sp. MG133]